jgi:hypothetical protein
MLKFPPFAASQAMEAAARNQPPLTLNMRGSAVALLRVQVLRSVQLGRG